MRSPLPSLDGAIAWVNGSQPQPEDLAGKVLLIHFWSISCYICHEVVEEVNSLRDEYLTKGVVVLAVHQPRSESELDIDAVTKDLQEEMKLTQPCAIDNDHAIVSRFENQYVPGYYVFSKAGEMRHFQTGGKGYERITKALDKCLEEE
ncbi:MAG: redoxin domain-containing protein [Anaerolineae bacterium]|nr:redoxin domain-containing protein [Gloeobacterales cyanobacterium ES-bin-313]